MASCAGRGISSIPWRRRSREGEEVVDVPSTALPVASLFVAPIVGSFRRALLLRLADAKIVLFRMPLSQTEEEKQRCWWWWGGEKREDGVDADDVDVDVVDVDDENRDDDVDGKALATLLLQAPSRRADRIRRDRRSESCFCVLLEQLQQGLLSSVFYRGGRERFFDVDVVVLSMLRTEFEKLRVALLRDWTKQACEQTHDPRTSLLARERARERHS